MATFLDVTALENFSVIFIFLLVWIGGYALLLYTKVLGQNQFINIIISMIMAFLTIISPLATSIFKSIAPFISVMLVLVMIVSITAGMFGKVDVESFPGMKWLAIAVIIIAIVVSALSIVRENIEVPERGEDFGKISTVIFHPNFLGMILILLVAVFTIGLLASKQG